MPIRNPACDLLLLLLLLLHLYLLDWMLCWLSLLTQSQAALASLLPRKPAAVALEGALQQQELPSRLPQQDHLLLQLLL
jgi:hypothetical protein